MTLEEELSLVTRVLALRKQGKIGIIFWPNGHGGVTICHDVYNLCPGSDCIHRRSYSLLEIRDLVESYETPRKEPGRETLPGVKEKHDPAA